MADEPFYGGDQANLPGDAEVYIVNRKTGERGVVPRDKAHIWAEAGYELETPEETKDVVLEREYGDQPLAAITQGAARTITFGASDFLDPEGHRETRNRNEGMALAGEIGGAVLGAGVGLGGAVTGASKAAGALAQAKAGTGLGAKVVGATTRGATEGAAYGVGTGVSEIAMSKDPVTWESGAASIGSNALGGAVIGGAIGAGAKLLEEGAAFAKAKANRDLEKLTAPTDGVQRADFPEFANLDKKATREAIVVEREAVRAGRATELEAATAAKKAELATIETQKDAAAEALFQEARAYKDSLKFVPVADRELAKQLGNANKSMMRSLDNPKGFIRQRGSHGFVEGLEKQEAALAKVLGDADDVLAKADLERLALIDSLPKPKAAQAAAAADELPWGFRDFDATGLDGPARAGMKVSKGLPKFDDLHTTDRVGRKVEAPPQLHVVKLDELEQAGIFSDKIARNSTRQIDAMRGEFAKGPDAFAKEKVPPLELWMAADGKMHIYDGNHRLAAALAEGSDREVLALIRPAPGGALPAESTGRFTWAEGRVAKPAAGAVAQAADAPIYLTPEQSRLYADYAGIKLSKKQPALAVSADDLEGFRAAVERGDINPPSVQRVLDAQEMLQKNQELQGKIKEIRAGAASDALAAAEQRIEAARAGLAKSPRLDALEAHLADLNDPSLAQRFARGAGAVVGGAAGFAVGGPVGAAAAGFAGREAGERVYKRLFQKIQAGNESRAKSIKSSVAALFASGTEKAAARVAPLASKIMPSITYAEPAYADAVMGPANEKPSKSAVVNDFRARARELNALTERTPEGGFTVRMQAREELNERLQGLWAVDPDFANGVEMTHNRRIEFLASKLPRNPAPPHIQVGPDTWEPSRAELAKFARYMEAAEKPETILQRMSTGTMTPEDAEVLKTVYPSMYEDTRRQVEASLAEARSLPYQKRLALSIFLDVAADPAVTPEAITVYQGLYKQQMAQGAGGAPGGPAPAPKAFKSSEKPTRAQNAGA